MSAYGGSRNGAMLAVPMGDPDHEATYLTEARTPAKRAHDTLRS